jgi:hypothetical protein
MCIDGVDRSVLHHGEDHGEKTGVRSRGELVGQVFLEHYAARWDPARAPAGWDALDAG